MRPTVTSTVCPGATDLGMFTLSGPPIFSPESKTMVYEVVHVQVPTFFRRQVLLKVAPGAKVVPSGTVTSDMNCARSQPAGGGWLRVQSSGR